MKRAFTNVLARDVEATAAFYEALPNMTRHFESDWFVISTHSEMNGFEFGILDRSAKIVPAPAAGASRGVMLTFVVEDCDAVHGRARELSASIVETPTDMPYGQRRMLLQDPDGTFVDVSAPTPAAPAAPAAP